MCWKTVLRTKYFGLIFLLFYEYKRAVWKSWAEKLSVRELRQISSRSLIFSFCFFYLLYCFILNIWIQKLDLKVTKLNWNRIWITPAKTIWKEYIRRVLSCGTDHHLTLKYGQPSVSKITFWRTRPMKREIFLHVRHTLRNDSNFMNRAH